MAAKSGEAARWPRWVKLIAVCSYEAGVRWGAHLGESSVTTSTGARSVMATLTFDGGGSS
jgi:hypothetical protein